VSAYSSGDEILAGDTKSSLDIISNLIGSSKLQPISGADTCSARSWVASRGNSNLDGLSTFEDAVLESVIHDDVE